MKKTILFILMSLAIIKLSNSQTTTTGLVQKVSEVVTGNTDTANLGPILKVGANSYVVSSNQKVTSTQNNMQTTCLNGNIIIQWNQQHTAGTGKAFSTFNTKDNAGNIIVVGAAYVNGLNGYDLTVVKYAPTGGSPIWVKYYNGPGNNYDVATSVVIDASNNVYVSGASFGGLFAQVDYVTIKFNSAGTQQWVSRYNFSNGLDLPTGICIDNSNNIIVSGSSSSSSFNNNMDFTTVKYNSNTGAQMQVQRQANVGNAKDIVTGQFKDAFGNIYVTGSTSSNGIDFDIQLLKYDASMNLLWSKIVDGYGKSDQGNDVTVDPSGNVYVTGYFTRPNLTKELVLLKYNTAGTQLYLTKKQPVFNQSDAEGIKVIIKNTNEVFVGANYTKNSNKDAALLRFNVNGVQNLEAIYNGSSNLKDELLDMLVDGNFVVLSAKSFNGIIDQNVTVKYEYKDFNQTPVFLNANEEIESKELIVRFDKATLKLGAINNKDFLFGKLNDFIQDSTCSKMDSILRGKCQFKSAEIETRKIFYKATSNDTLSISRMGDTVKLPPVYSSLLIKLPECLGIDTIGRRLMKLYTDIISANYNRVYRTFASNDPEYVLQHSLNQSASYPNGYVNVDSAWAFTTGENNIKVGVFDSGIEFNHSDYTGVTTGGYNYVNNTSLSNLDEGNHGTAVSGIIGAVRNNGIGIAGIAGGDASIGKQGVTMHDCKICAFSVCYTSSFIQGVFNEVTSPSIGGNGLNVLNFSIGTGGANNPFNLYWPETEQINLANKHGAAICAAKGNFNAILILFPADIGDEVVMAVGSSGTDGNYCVLGTNCSNNSGRGTNIDFIAPGTDSLVKTLYVGNTYIKDDGTSFATPHVSGASALMMSYINSPLPSWDNLAGEDCEYILQRTATDITTGTYSETVGYDEATGWGRVNVNRAISKLKKGFYTVKHADLNHFATGVKSSTPIAVNVPRNWPQLQGVPQGTHNTIVYEQTTTLNFSLSPTQSLVAVWPHTKECIGNRDSSTIRVDRPYYCEIVSFSQSQVVMRTWFHYSTLHNKFYPADNSIVNTAASLYIYDPTGVMGINDTHNPISDLVVYPNPSKGIFNLNSTFTKNQNITISVTDIFGRELFTKNQNALQGENNFKLDLSTFQEGVYFVNFREGVINFKTVKVIKF